MKREVSADLEAYVSGPSTLEFQISVAFQTGVEVTELLSIQIDGVPIQPRELVAAHGTRIHKIEAHTGLLTAHYEATVYGRAEPLPVSDYERSMYLRPSRYAESDKFFGFAAAEFGGHTDARSLLTQISSWVGSRLSYVPGSSTAIDGSVDTLLAGQGVCRDYAHLVVALLRARFVPARQMVVYAPGCCPMDFHSVAEACVDGVWRIADATCLAPRSTMVRIATGRDAADTAFLDNHGGEIVLNQLQVAAWIDGPLPRDDIRELISAG